MFALDAAKHIGDLLDVIILKIESTMGARLTVGKFVLRGTTSFWLERKLLCESIPHFCYFQLGRFEDPIVDARQGMLPTPYSVLLDVATVPFHHKCPGCPHRSRGFDSICDMQQAVHHDRACQHPQRISLIEDS